MERTTRRDVLKAAVMIAVGGTALPTPAAVKVQENCNKTSDVLQILVLPDPLCDENTQRVDPAKDGSKVYSLVLVSHRDVTEPIDLDALARWNPPGKVLASRTFRSRLGDCREIEQAIFYSGDLDNDHSYEQWLERLVAAVHAAEVQKV